MTSRRRGIAWLFALVAASATSGIAHATSREGLPVTLKAWVSTAGSQGEAWELIVTGDDAGAADADATLEVMYLLEPQGTLLAHWRLAGEDLGSLRVAVEEQRFWDLPARLAPPAVGEDRPHLNLEIRIGERRHKVTVDDPAGLGNDKRLQRVLKVWTAVWQAVPLRPEW